MGVYVRALLPGGAAEQSGLVEPGDQLVAVGGAPVFDATFDAAMTALATVGAAPTLEFFRGSREELLEAVGRETKKTGTATVTVVDPSGRRREIVVQPGANLRDTLVNDGIDVYRGTTAWTNCAGHQMCGTRGAGVLVLLKSFEAILPLRRRRDPADDPRGGAATPRTIHAAAAAAPPPRTIHLAPVAAPRHHGRSTRHPAAPRPVHGDGPRGTRGGAATPRAIHLAPAAPPPPRNIHVAPAAAPRRHGRSTWRPRRYPRGGRGGAATRPRNIRAAKEVDTSMPRK